MVRCNLLGLGGGILSSVAIALFWSWALLSAGFGSGDPELTQTLTYWLAVLSGLAILGALLSLGTPLGALLQIPGIIYFAFFDWHYGWHYEFWAGTSANAAYVPAIIGVAMSILSMFMDLSIPGFRPRMPPESRTRVWYTWREERERKKLSKVQRYAAATVVLAVALVSAGTIGAAYVVPMATVEVYATIGSDIPTNVNVTFYLDGATVLKEDLAFSGGFASCALIRNVTAGTHLLEIDVAGGFNPLTHTLYQSGVMDYSLTLRVLPFTTDDRMVAVGAAFA